MVSIDYIEDVEVGGLYTDGKNSVWEVKSYANVPTVTLKNLRTGEETRGGIGCLNFAPFVKLVPEQKAQAETGFQKFLPHNTWTQKLHDGEFVVVVPTSDGVEHRYYGKTSKEAREKALDVHGKPL